MRSFRSAALVSAAVMLLTASPAQAHAALHVPNHKRTTTTSTNWSGYASDGSGATDVIGTWTQPTATCAAGENSWSSPWVGIDGDNSNTVEQTGTDSDCNNGAPTYYAWYEMYPKALVTINMTVRPGDSYTAEARYSGGAFVLTLIDTTTGARFTTTQASKKARRSSVEWIMEGPSNGLLTNFGQLPFTSTAATISGSAQTIANATPITMLDGQGLTRAQPGPVAGSPYGVSFERAS